MQRQSLGSPGSKLRIHESSGTDSVITSDDQNHRVSSSSTSSNGTVNTDDDEIKLEKPHRNIKPEKFIHVIPILTLFCFLILYLSSHEPSQNDLANFNGFRRPDEIIDSSMDDSVRFVNRGEVFAIRSLRNLQETGKDSNNKSRSRKLGDF